MLGLVTNGTSSTAAGALFPDGQQASGSLPHESNEWHVVGAIALVAAIVIAAGAFNAKLSIGRGSA